MDHNPCPNNQNWLAFSLSNYSHQLSLFQNPNVNSEELNVGATSRLLGEAPKLEDFLGGPTAAGLPQLDASAFFHQDAATATKQLAVAQPPAKKTGIESYGQRTSIFRGVTRHRWTGRYEAHLWDNSCRREGQSRKGRQVYLGGYDKEEKAARAYDLAALKYWGPTTTTNFPVSDYEKEMEEMKNMTRQEFVASLRRKSSGFSRGASIYRGVTRHHQHGRWQARIGRVAGNKDLYLGTFSTQEEAAEAYDIAAIKFRGLNAVTNFDMSRYDVKSIATSNLPVGGITSNKCKTSSESQLVDNSKSLDSLNQNNTADLSSAASVGFPTPSSTSNINFALPIKQDQSPSLWAAIGYQNNAAMNSVPGNIGGVNSQPLNMEFQPSSNEDMFVAGGYFQQQQDDQQGSSGTTSSGSVALNVSSNGPTHDTLAYSNSTWIPQSNPPYQPRKSNLSAFQTPIFGLE